MAEWQPIATAPRDGTWFLAYEDGDMYACSVILNEDGTPADFRLNDDGDPVLGYAAYCGQPVVSSPEPTHWQPLPEPPQ